MVRCCAKCVLAIGAGLAIGVVLAFFSHGCYLWASLGVGLGIGACMALGESYPASENSV